MTRRDDTGRGVRPGTPADRRALLALRAAFVAAGILLAFFAIRVARERTADLDALKQVIASTGLEARQPGAVAALLKDPDPAHARLDAARLLVAECSSAFGDSNDDPRQVIDIVSHSTSNLATARTLAMGVLRTRPAAWDGFMVIGASWYLDWWLHGDPRLLTDRDTWEKPLERAIALAPGEDEPVRLLAMARLTVWNTLTADQHRATIPLLSRAFEDGATFRRLAPLWLEVAGSLKAAGSVIPDDPDDWRAVERVLVRRKDWPGYVEARRHEAASRDRWLARQIASVEERVRGGDLDTARRMAQATISGVPPDGRWAAGVARLLELMPPGPLPGYMRRSFAAWLDWTLDRYARGESGLPPQAVDRLSFAVGDQPPATRALADLAGGHLTDAELLERRHHALNTDAWGPYTIAKARVMLKRGEVAAARSLLAATSPRWSGTPSADAVRQAVDAAAGVTPAAPGTSEQPERWPPSVWWWTGATVTAEILLPPEARGLEISLEKVPSEGAVVEVRVDGSVAAVTWLAPDQALSVPARPGAHTVALVPVAGGRVIPGAIEVLAVADAGGAKP